MSRTYNFRLRMFFWTGFYLLLVTLPLIIARVDHEKSWRGFWMEFGVAMGLIGFSMMVLQFLLTGRFNQIAPRFGSDAVLQFHRYVGITSYLFILGHIVTVISANPEYAYYFHPGDNAPRAIALSVALLSLSAVIITSIWREKINLSYEWWLMIHGSLSLMVVFIGLAHMIMVGHYIDSLWKQTLWAGMAFFSMAMIIYIRIITPLLIAKRPYMVSAVKKEADQVWTLEIESVNHEGLKFQAGQFASLIINYQPFTFEQNPFSIASSDALSRRLSFTIKEFGDFTSKIKDLRPGHRVYLSGPYGSFTLRDDTSPIMFVIGGIGVTPVMSILRSLRDKNNKRQMVLIYANKTKENVAFKKELDQLEQELNLQVIHVMDSLPKGWKGEEGMINGTMLKKYRIVGTNVLYYVCGPPPLMDIAETTFLEWGVLARNINSERFAIV